MRPRDIYDDMPDGAAQRDRTKQRLAELEGEGASRRARLAEVIACAELAGQVVLPMCPHTLGRSPLGRAFDQRLAFPNGIAFWSCLT